MNSLQRMMKDKKDEYFFLLFNALSTLNYYLLKTYKIQRTEVEAALKPMVSKTSTRF